MPKKEAAEIVLSVSDNKMVRALTAPGSRIEVVIPDTLDEEGLYRTLEVCVKATNYINATKGKLLPLIGRGLMLYKDHPEYYKSKGYKSWDDFVSRGVQEKMGLSRTDCYDAIQQVRSFPSLSIEEYAAIPRESWRVIRKVTDQYHQGYEKIINMAKGESTREFVQKLEAKGLLEKGEGQFAHFIVQTTHNIAHEAAEFFDNPAVQARVGSKDRGQILRAMIQEVAAEWLTEEPVVDDAKAS